MKNIILLCEHGASTSIIVEQMKECAKKRNYECTINAYSYTKLDEIIDGADVVLLGPQVRFKKKQFEEQYKEYGIEFVLIDPVSYGMMDGDKILDLAINHMQ